jgi:hypothetical protein
MMPVERLPAASWVTALGLGFDSAVFDNIPLTALALRQGGYDWGMLAYVVGFAVLMGSLGWQPQPRLRDAVPPAAEAARE